MSTDRTLGELNSPDEDFELSVRPTRFADFAGQAKVKERLQLLGDRS